LAPQSRFQCRIANLYGHGYSLAKAEPVLLQS